MLSVLLISKDISVSYISNPSFNIGDCHISIAFSQFLRFLKAYSDRSAARRLLEVKKRVYLLDNNKIVRYYVYNDNSMVILNISTTPIIKHTLCRQTVLIVRPSIFNFFRIKINFRLIPS